MLNVIVCVCCMCDGKADTIRQFINGGPRVEWSLLSRTHTHAYIYIHVMRQESNETGALFCFI